VRPSSTTSKVPWCLYCCAPFFALSRIPVALNASQCTPMIPVHFDDPSALSHIAVHYHDPSALSYTLPTLFHHCSSLYASLCTLTHPSGTPMIPVHSHHPSALTCIQVHTDDPTQLLVHAQNTAFYSILHIILLTFYWVLVTLNCRFFSTKFIHKISQPTIHHTVKYIGFSGMMNTVTFVFLASEG